MPTGKVKWYDVEKGFGFLSRDDGGDVFVHSSALPTGLATLVPGTRVEFGIAQGRRGEQALSLRVLEPPPSVAKGARRSTDDLQSMVEDVIRLLDGVASRDLRRGRYPERQAGRKVATLLRAVADELEG